MDSGDIYGAVQKRYSAVAQDQWDERYTSAVAASFGYSKADLESIPKGANLGLSCGNPLIIAGLKEAGSAIHPDESILMSARVKQSSIWAVALGSMYFWLQRRSEPQEKPLGWT